MIRPIWKRRMLFVAAALIIGWMLVRWFNPAEQRNETHDAARLLYQVSLFQLELLYGHLNDAMYAGASGQLDLLKQSAYTVNYTHHRLRLVLGERNVGSLSSVEQLLQYILRLQIGGNRNLEAEEIEVLRAAQPLFHRLYEAYRLLLASDGSVIGSKSDEIATVDRELFELFQQKLLE